jgi:phosphoribosyl-AMP cyclohydrolase
MTNIISQLTFNSDGLIPVIAQDIASGEVLMLAWMNKEAVEETLRTGRVCYWSRSRQQLWRKGETSGQVQHLKELILDCDSDSLLAKIEQTGVACHTGRRSCFYKTIEGDAIMINQDVMIAADELYKK